jgi:hypothetical protein
VQLKQYFKEKTPNPSPTEIDRLAAEVMMHAGDAPVVAEWFGIQRMKEFEKDEELIRRARDAELAVARKEGSTVITGCYNGTYSAVHKIRKSNISTSEKNEINNT